MKCRWILPVFGLFLVLGGAPAGRASSDDADQAYVAEEVQGDVTVVKKGQTQAILLREGDVLAQGDEIRVGFDGEATMTLGDDQVIRLERDTRIRLAQAKPNPEGGFLTRLQLAAGSLLSEVKNLAKRKSSFEVESGGVVCGVRGTIFEVSNDGGEIGAQTHEGEVAVVGAGGLSESVKAGQGAAFRNKRLIRRVALAKAGRERLKRWREFRQVIQEMRQARRAGRIGEFKRERLEKMRQMLLKHPGMFKRKLPPLKPKRR